MQDGPAVFKAAVVGMAGDRLVLSAFGAGFTAGSVYLRWAI